MNPNSLPLRKAYPTPIRNIILYGGPLDGHTYRDSTPPSGYTDTGGALAIWHEIDVDLLWDRR